MSPCTDRHEESLQNGSPSSKAVRQRTAPATEGIRGKGEESMFSIQTRHDNAGRVIVIGRPTRKRAQAFLNIPISDNTRRRLDEQLVGSLAMGASALLEWALQELQQKEISIEARPQN